MTDEKPLFIPLCRQWFDEFEAGLKTEEFRPAGGRWNARTCRIGRQVTLSCGYGRSVALCRAGSADINREMVLRGWAVAYWTDDFKAEEQQAKAAKRGIWAMRFKQPEDYRHNKKGG